MKQNKRKYKKDFLNKEKASYLPLIVIGVVFIIFSFLVYHGYLLLSQVNDFF